MPQSFVDAVARQPDQLAVRVGATLDQRRLDYDESDTFLIDGLPVADVAALEEQLGLLLQGGTPVYVTSPDHDTDPQSPGTLLFDTTVT